MILYTAFMGLCAVALFLWLLATFRDTPALTEAIRLASSSSERD